MNKLDINKFKERYTKEVVGNVNIQFTTENNII